jgi:hypothetical protein
MATVYAAKVLSVGKKGVMAQVTLLGGKVVTRHIIAGKGFHPDDAIPQQHKRLEAARDLLKEKLAQVQDAIKVAEHAVKTNQVPSKVAEAVLALPVLRAYVLKTPLYLNEVETALHTLRQNDPIFVSYHLDLYEGRTK